MSSACLYWITLNPSQDNLWTDGYVGVTTHLPKRHHQHMTGGRSCFTPAKGHARDEYTLVILEELPYSDEDEQYIVLERLLERELELRPHPNIGLNERSGGGNSRQILVGSRNGGLTGAGGRATKKTHGPQMGHGGKRNAELWANGTNEHPSRITYDLFTLEGKLIASGVSNPASVKAHVKRAIGIRKYKRRAFTKIRIENTND